MAYNIGRSWTLPTPTDMLIYFLFGWLNPRPGRYIPVKEIQCPLYRRLGGIQGRFGDFRKISLTPGFDTRLLQSLESQYADYALAANSKRCKYKLWNFYAMFSSLAFIKEMYYTGRIFFLTSNLACVYPISHGKIHEDHGQLDSCI
jgi:hypothetical protein